MSDTRAWQFYLTPEAAWDAMMRDCEAAQESIELEQYIFENDALGQKFMDLFIRKAAEGVDVLIVCDKFGSQRFEGSSQIKALLQNGGRFHFYNDVNFLNWLTPWRWFPRTHVKRLLVDSRVAHVGGVCVAERMRLWRDTQIRVTGAVTAQVGAGFDHMRKRLKAPKRMRKTTSTDKNMSYVENHPWLLNRAIYKMIRKAIQNSQTCVYISTAYFVPNRRFRHALIKAAKRGVDVRILVPAQSDSLIADWVCLSYAKRLLKRGVRLFHYQAETLHNKTVVVDHGWATVGSANMDVLSFFYNREANLAITDQEAISEMKTQFLNDIEQSRALTLDDMNNRPLRVKIVGFIGRYIQTLLRT